MYTRVCSTKHDKETWVNLIVPVLQRAVFNNQWSHSEWGELHYEDSGFGYIEGNIEIYKKHMEVVCELFDLSYEMITKNGKVWTGQYWNCDETEAKKHWHDYDSRNFVHP